MAIYHMSVKAIQRSKGQSSTAASAYRSGSHIKDKQTGEIHDYTKKKGVEYITVISPDGTTAPSRVFLWNTAEAIEKRKDATVAKEFEVSLPVELSKIQRQILATDFAYYLSNRHQCVADVAIHAPSKQGDQRNHHAHILITTRKYEGGTLTQKTDMELSDKDRKKKGLGGRKEELEDARKSWENLVNRALEHAKIADRVDCRSLEEQGLERLPTKHMGKRATALERKGIVTDKGDFNRIVKVEQNITITPTELYEARLKRVEEARENYARLNQRRDILSVLKAFPGFASLNDIQLRQQLGKIEKMYTNSLKDKENIKNKISEFHKKVEDIGLLARTFHASALKCEEEGLHKDLIEVTRSVESQEKILEALKVVHGDRETENAQKELLRAQDELSRDPMHQKLEEAKIQQRKKAVEEQLRKKQERKSLRSRGR